MTNPLECFLTSHVIFSDWYENELTEDTISSCLPVGWQKFSRVIMDASRMCNTNILGIDIRDGVLYIDYDDSGNSEMFNRISRSISQESSLTCMMCGSFGRRRKEQVGKPPLCRDHYLEYINNI